MRHYPASKDNTDRISQLMLFVVFEIRKSKKLLGISKLFAAVEASVLVGLTSCVQDKK
ncbi:hypothetical protein [Thermoflexibacter ruber]|uniref:hypothetical protein n=1 Tax=Thermoflexibacter ruber TaxID=1003 RepID=UPI0015A64BDD|nr:hypothetical protein [Thermoflexibacter ruber]